MLFLRLKALAAFYRYLLSVLCWSTQSGSWDAVIMQVQAWSGHRWSKLHSLVDWKSFQSCFPQKCRLDWQFLKCLPMLKIEALLFLFSQLREFWIPRKATKLLIYYKVWFFLSSNINSILYPHDFSSFSSKPLLLSFISFLLEWVGWFALLQFKVDGMSLKKIWYPQRISSFFYLFSIYYLDVPVLD